MGRKRERKNRGNRDKSRRSRSKSKAKLECQNCGKKGHRKKNCWLRKKKKGEGHHDNLQETNIAGTIVQDALIISFDNINDAQVVDM